jgi:hypothetical protein
VHAEQPRRRLPGADPARGRGERDFAGSARARCGAELRGVARVDHRGALAAHREPRAIGCGTRKSIGRASQVGKTTPSRGRVGPVPLLSAAGDIHVIIGREGYLMPYSSKLRRAFAAGFGMLRRIADWAGQVPSLGFGLLYLAVIPLFAWLYTMFPFDFFHSTAIHEPMVVAQGDAIGVKLRRAFLEDAESNASRRPLLYGRPVQPTRDGVYPIFSVQPEIERVRIIVYLIVPDGIDVAQPYLKIALDLDESSVLHSANGNAPYRESEWYSKVLFFVDVKAQVITGHNVDLLALFPCGSVAQTTCLKMTTADYSALLSLKKTAAGRPSAYQGSYLRMLYFSAVTISTLGYGDIVPLTSRARALVTLEIILGPLLFGLFLNSLVKETSRVRSQSDRQSDSTVHE